MKVQAGALYCSLQLYYSRKLLSTAVFSRLVKSYRWRCDMPQVRSRIIRSWYQHALNFQPIDNETSAI